MRTMFRACRKVDGHGGTDVFGALECDSSAVGLDDGLCDSQAWCAVLDMLKCRSSSSEGRAHVRPESRSNCSSIDGGFSTRRPSAVSLEREPASFVLTKS